MRYKIVVGASCFSNLRLTIAKINTSQKKFKKNLIYVTQNFRCLLLMCHTSSYLRGFKCTNVQLKLFKIILAQRHLLQGYAFNLLLKMVQKRIEYFILKR